MKKHFLLAALPLALACGSTLAAQDVFELHGYMRAGAGRSSNGGEQTTFYLAGLGDNPTAGPGYRLGNEMDNYIELAMDVRAYEKGNESFKLHFRPSFREYYVAKDSDADAGGNANMAYGASPNQQVFLREAWGEAQGFLGTSDTLKDASIWAGRRFYQRQDLHIRDLWYWNDSGDGVGIENVNLGFGKFHYAYIQHDEHNVAAMWDNGYETGTLQTGSPWAGIYNGQIVIGSHDFRVSDLSPWKNASITVGFQYNEPHVSKLGNTINGIDAKNYNNIGRQWLFLWTQSGIWGGDNKVFLTAGDGSTFWNWYNPELSTKNNWTQVMDILFIQPTPWFGMQFCAIQRIQSADHTQNAAQDSKWTSIGGRPTFFLTKHFSIATELGIDRFKVDGDSNTRFLVKRTVALQWEPQRSFWSRPVIRLFATKANWNKQANSWNIIGQGVFGPNATTGTTYGCQIEAWW